jgi:outer membrane protein assembly factor BamB
MHTRHTSTLFLRDLKAAAVAACGLVVLVLGSFAASAATAKSPPQSTPALDVLPQFTAPNVPAAGPEELPIDPPRWIVSTNETDPSLPGGGIARHPMLYIGEGCNKMFLVNDGKVIWTYSTGKGWEYDDIWLMSNGNILFSRMSWAAEATPQKKIVWRIDAPKGTEIHTVQPLGLDKVLLMQNGTPPKLMVINKKTGAVEVEHGMPDDGKGVHAQFRRVRMTGQGTYLVPFLQMNKVVEYDKDFNELWSYKINSPWAAIRLHNGNTLITDERDALTREVNPKGETVWEIKLSELPPEYRLADSQSCVRLANGNTILCSRGNGGKRPQLVEVTPDKKVVWVLNDWKNLGPATAVQILDDPGIPENPGDLQR